MKSRAYKKIKGVKCGGRLQTIWKEIRFEKYAFE